MRTYYSTRYVLAAHDFETTRKARWVADSLTDLPIAGVELVAPEPLTESQVASVHAPEYVTAVRTGQPRALAESQGFRWDPQLFQMVLASNGGVVAAAFEALQHGVSGSLSSGLHHAGHARGAGFCTFNGLAITALKLLSEGLVQRVLILDCDQHLGDGTDDILTKLNAFDRVNNASLGRRFKRPKDAKPYLAKVRELANSFSDYGLVLYQASADVHVNDPLGGVLTTEQMIERDRIVFEAARSSGVPLAWNLAGGYQDPVANVVVLHVNTMRECVRAYASGQAASAEAAR